MKINFIHITVLLFVSLFLSGQVSQDTSLVINHSFLADTDPTPIHVEIRDGKVFFEDDILIGDAEAIFRDDTKRSATISPISSAGNLWTDNIVPFEIPDNHPERSSITQAITHVMSRTNLTFVHRTNETNYIRFVSGQDGCFSNIGMIGGEQTINMDGNCGLGAGIHEIGHAIGLFHEHTRNDRDIYVNINWNNIIEDKKSNFQKYNERGFRGVDFDDYDYNSVMHYYENTFSLYGQPTIAIKSPPAKPGTTLGNTRLSPIDILSINNLYRILPRTNADIELNSELAPLTNPVCLGVPFQVNVSVQNIDMNPSEGRLQLLLHDRNSGQNLLFLGVPQEYILNGEDASYQTTINVEPLDIASNEYFLALWKLDENGNPQELVRDGEYLNGKEISIAESCDSQNPDIYEFNDTESAAFNFDYSGLDSSVVFATEGSDIHTTSDIDYYTFSLPRDSNYFIDIELKDSDDNGENDNFTNDVIVSHRKLNEEWTDFKNLLFEPEHILNGGTIQYRVKSHFPGDTGSYLLSIKVDIDPDPMLEVAEKRITVGPEDTTALIMIQSNRSWSISNSDQWVTSPDTDGFGYDTVHLSLEANTSFDERTTSFLIENENDGLSLEVSLTQDGVQRILTGEFRNKIVCNEDSKALVFIESNTDWTSSTEEQWMDIVKSEGSQNDYIEVDLSVNLLGETRSGSITLETVDGEFTNSIKIFQPGRNDVKACVDPVLFEVNKDGGSVQFEIMTNQNWTIESEESWISDISALEGNSSETISFNYSDLSDTTEGRQARIKVLVENVGIINILVRQGSDFSNSAFDLNNIPDEHIQIYPNPFSNNIFGNLYLGSPSKVVIIVMDIHGNPVLTPISQQFVTGWNKFTIEDPPILSGIYLIRIVSENSSRTIKMIKI